MRFDTLTGLIAAAALLAGLAGCSSMPSLNGKKIDYKSASASSLPSLVVPPDLTAPSADNQYAVPAVKADGATTFSAYRKGQGVQQQRQMSTLLPEEPKVSMHRAGSERWLVVNMVPAKVWPIMKAFWQENGFIIKTEIPAAGIMETDWAENRAKIPEGPIRRLLGKIVDNLYSTPERDKFRTRLERGVKPGTTEIYISHRGMYQVIEGGDGGDRAIWEPMPPDPGLEAEMLRRVMVRFGVQKARANAMVATENVREHAVLTKLPDGSSLLTMLDPFDRAWRRVGLALDRVGFTVEDRDRAKGIYYVRYINPEAGDASNDQGFLSKLAFWRSHSDKPGKVQYQVHVKKTAQGSAVDVRDKDGKPDNSTTAGKIISLLYGQLK
ncbi:MAG TPA: hypothetical protein DEP05_09880 [Betaproteobacteria bacterium]|nr:hypothetical protein [Betaproteobacteria bacterium]